MIDTNLLDARESSLHLASLLRREQGAQADFLVALAAFDEAGAFRRLGYANLFDYLHRELLLPRSSAHYRKVAARLIRRFPEMVGPLRGGRLCLSTVVEVEKVLTEENWADVLPRFFGLSRQEAKEVVAELRPAQVVPRRTVVTDVSLRREVTPGETGAGTSSPGELDLTHPARVQPPDDAAMRAVEVSRPLVEPMTATASRMHITVSREFLALLKKAKSGQSHVQPGATDEDVLRAALELLVEKQEKRRASVPAKVKREVRARDEGKCQWKLASGGICGSEIRTEIDHVVPRGRGGPSTVANSRILCRVHNIEAARQAYGDAHMDLFTVRVPTAGEPVADYLLTAPPGPRRGSRPSGPGSSPAGPAAARRRGRWRTRRPGPPRIRCSGPPRR